MNSECKIQDQTNQPTDRLLRAQASTDNRHNHFYIRRSHVAGLIRRRGGATWRPSGESLAVRGGVWQRPRLLWRRAKLYDGKREEDPWLS